MIMYFYRKKSKSGRCLQLLESYRPKGASSPRHRVVLSLGDADVPDEWLPELAVIVTNRLTGNELILLPELPPEALEWADRIVHEVERRRMERRSEAAAGRPRKSLPVTEVEHSHSVPLGPVLVGLRAWDVLEMDKILAEAGFNPRQRRAACALILGRLAEPLSENGFYDWLPHSCLPDLLGSEVTRGGVQRYYRIGDRLWEKHRRIEAELRERVAKYFGLKRTLFLYDLTNFHFEGACAANPKAKRGHNKQKRNDCPQVVIGMVFDEFGFELLHRTFPGNTADCKTLPEMAKALLEASTAERLTAAESPMVVVDGGLATRENLAELQRLGFDYLVNDKRARRGVWAEMFEREEGFSPVSGREESRTVLVRHVDVESEEPGGAPERVVLCKSARRGEKESAILSKAEERFREALNGLAARIESGA